MLERCADVARSLCLPTRLRNSTGPELVATNQCGVRVSNSAASPGFEGQVVLAEEQSELAVEDEDPDRIQDAYRASLCVRCGKELVTASLSAGQGSGSAPQEPKRSCMTVISSVWDAMISPARSTAGW